MNNDNAPEPQQELEDAAKNESEKASLWQKLRHPFRFKINLHVAPREDSAEGGASPKPEKKKKEKKPKPEKQPKPKKEKKPKAKKQKASEDEGGKKKLPLLVIILGAVGVVAIGAVLALVVFRSSPTPQARLEKAAEYLQKEKFDKAAGMYDELIAEELVLEEAYLGAAEVFLTQEDTASAITKLEAGYQQTGSQKISERLAQLKPDEPLAPVEAAVTFSDPAFDSMLRLALGKAPGEEILQSELNSIKMLKILGGTHATVSKSSSFKDGEMLHSTNRSDGYIIGGELYTGRGEITSLDDLKYFPNLTRLTIGYNSIRDISGIRSAPSIQILGLYANEIEDISPLASCKGLRLLYIYHNHIKDIEVLSELKSLEQFYAQYNEIKDISSLSGLSSLSELYLDSNFIESISPVAGLEQLKFFSVKNNLVRDISPVAQLPAITDFFFDGCPVEDFAPALGISNVSPLASGRR